MEQYHARILDYTPTKTRRTSVDSGKKESIRTLSLLNSLFFFIYLNLKIIPKINYIIKAFF